MNTSLFVICFIFIAWLIDDTSDYKNWKQQRNQKPLTPKAKRK